MKDNESVPVPGMDAVESVAANSPNDKARTAVGSTDPYRFCTKQHEPYVANEDNMSDKS